MNMSTKSVAIVLICCVWYAISSFTAQMTKFALTKVPYPFLLAQAQYTITGFLAFCLMRLIRVSPSIRGVFVPGMAASDESAPLFRRQLFFKILPLGLLQSTGKYVSLCATQVVPVATVSSIKALSPLLIVLAYRIFYNERLPPLTYLSLVALLGGVVMIISADAAENSAGLISSLFFQLPEKEYLKGIIYCVVSVMLIATQQIYGKELVTCRESTYPSSPILGPKVEESAQYFCQSSAPPLSVGTDTRSRFPSPNSVSKSFTHSSSAGLPYATSDLSHAPHSTENPYSLEVDTKRSCADPLAYLSSNYAKADKLTVIFYISLIGVCTSAVGFLGKESYDLYHTVTGASHYEGGIHTRKDAWAVLALVVLMSVCHFAQTIISLFLLGSIPALSYSIASMMKRIVIIVISILVKHPESGQERWMGHVTWSQAAGLLLVGVGLYGYDRWGSMAMRQTRGY